MLNFHHIKNTYYIKNQKLLATHFFFLKKNLISLHTRQIIFTLIICSRCSFCSEVSDWTLDIGDRKEDILSGSHELNFEN